MGLPKNWERSYKGDYTTQWQRKEGGKVTGEVSISYHEWDDYVGPNREEKKTYRTWLLSDDDGVRDSYTSRVKARKAAVKMMKKRSPAKGGGGA